MEQKYQRLELADTSNETAFSSGSKAHFKPEGGSGTEVHGGYFAEEYLQKLRGTRGMQVYEEMRRSEPQVVMLLGAIQNPIKSANWSVEAPQDVEKADLHKEFIEANLKNMIDWETTLNEILSFLAKGFSLFEVVHNVVFDHEKFGTFNGLKALAFRNQKTIEKWNFDTATGELQSVTQETQGDVKRSVTIPADALVIFSVNKEGDNFEGISLLRPMFGPWFRKNTYLKLAAIGVEKNAIGTPIGTVPAGKEKSPEFQTFQQILAGLTSHESSFATIAEGWKIEIVKGEFNASQIKELIVMENTEMINSVVANFLALGTSGSGSYALGTDLSDFFLGGIQAYANLVCGVINRQLIPNLIKLNYGPQKDYPKLSCSGINDKAGAELATILSTLSGAGFVKPDLTLEEYLRAQYKLPKKEEPVIEPEVVPPQTALQFAEKRLKLDEKYKKTFDKNKVAVKDLMQDNLQDIFQTMKKQITSKWNNSTPATRLKIANDIEVSDTKYLQALKELLAQIATTSIDQARREVPKAKKVKLAEIKLDAPRGGYFAALPPHIKRLVEAQSRLVATTQIADVQKVVMAQFIASTASELTIEEVISNIDEVVTPVLDGATATGMSVDAAAANVVASTTNQARLEFFFAPEVLDEIESFTFVNEDPVSDICSELDGVTFAVNDPDLDRYSPPLHHNCKSRLVPNLKGDSNNPEIDMGGPSLSKNAIKSMTLGEGSCKCEVKLFKPAKTP